MLSTFSSVLSIISCFGFRSIGHLAFRYLFDRCSLLLHLHSANRQSPPLRLWWHCTFTCICQDFDRQNDHSLHHIHCDCPRPRVCDSSQNLLSFQKLRRDHLAARGKTFVLYTWPKEGQLDPYCLAPAFRNDFLAPGRPATPRRCFLGSLAGSRATRSARIILATARISMCISLTDTCTLCIHRMSLAAVLCGSSAWT